MSKSDKDFQWFYNLITELLRISFHTGALRMDIPQIGTPLGTIFITCCLWQWTIRKGKAHIFQQEVLLREQNRSASWAF